MSEYFRCDDQYLQPGSPGEHLTPAQKECYNFLCYIHEGENHYFETPKASGEDGLTSLLSFKSLATWDHDRLTRLVIESHRRAIRVQISSAGVHGLRIYLHKNTKAKEYSLKSLVMRIKTMRGFWDA